MPVPSAVYPGKRKMTPWPAAVSGTPDAANPNPIGGHRQPRAHQICHNFTEAKGVA